jgi:ankyrin repeat protein
MPPRKKAKMDPTLTPVEIQKHVHLIIQAAEAKDYNLLRTCVKDALTQGVSSAVRIPISGTELPLPAYLARTNSVPLLRQLLDDGVVSFSAANISADDMWEHINVFKSDIPHVCAVMEKFGDQLHGPCSMDLVQWIESNRMLAAALTTALSTAPYPYPHLARAVMEVTPINSQAVTIAAKHDHIEWLRKNAARLATIRPEGYASWEALRDHLVSQGGLTVNVQTMLNALVAGSQSAYHGTTVGKAFLDVLKEVYLTPTHIVSVADTCAALDRVGSELHNNMDELVERFSQMPGEWTSELVSELCRGTYPHLARAVAACFARYSTVDAEEKFVRVAVHYGFADILKKRVQNERGHFMTPVYEPTSSHRLSDNGKANAWLWLIKGDGDLTEKMWHMIEVLGLVSRYIYGGYERFFAGLSLSGTKIRGNFLSSSVVKALVSDCQKDIPVKYLVECGVDIVSLYPTALLDARNISIAKYLVQCGATLCADEHGQTPLHNAKKPELISFLVEIGADVNAVNSAGETALHRADYADVVRCLIAHKADVHARDNDGKTLLHSISHDDIVQLLIDHKADVSALDNTGKTPLHYLKYDDCVKILVENGADVEAVDEEGLTPLMVDAHGNYGDMAQSLLSNGANPNAKDPKGRTAMHYITNESKISAMIKMKADLNIRDNDGKTPLDLATDEDVISVLKRVGAKRSACE